MPATNGSAPPPAPPPASTSVIASTEVMPSSVFSSLLASDTVFGPQPTGPIVTTVHTSNIAPIVGGLVGGIAFTAILVILLCIFLRRPKRFLVEDYRGSVMMSGGAGGESVHGGTMMESRGNSFSLGSMERTIVMAGTPEHEAHRRREEMQERYRQATHHTLSYTQSSTDRYSSAGMRSPTVKSMSETMEPVPDENGYFSDVFRTMRK